MAILVSCSCAASCGRRPSPEAVTASQGRFATPADDGERADIDCLDVAVVVQEVQEEWPRLKFCLPVAEPGELRRAPMPPFGGLDVYVLSNATAPGPGITLAEMFHTWWIIAAPPPFETENEWRDLPEFEEPFRSRAGVTGTYRIYRLPLQGPPPIVPPNPALNERRNCYVF